MVALTRVAQFVIMSVLTLTSTTSVVYSQRAYRVDAPLRDTTIAPRQLADFPFPLTNLTDDSITIRVRRIINELPGSDWQSYICSSEKCYDTAENVMDPAGLQPGATFAYDLSVYTGFRVGEVGRVVLEITDGSSIDTLEFWTRVQENSGAEYEHDRDHVVVPYPNPTVDYVTIPGVENRVERVLVWSAAGVAVASIAPSETSTVSVDVRSLPSGTYHVTLVYPDGRLTSGGSFSVVR